MIAIGTVFGGDFRVTRLLGQGGMGAVYRAEQLSTGSPRALKLMQPDLLTDDELRRRFAQEARASSRIASDHVVQVIAAGVDQATNLPFIAMELLEGSTLADAIARGPMAHAEVREIMRQLLHAVAAAHAEGIVHRDLKPENVFLALSKREGAPYTVKVLDFGIAKVLAEGGAGQRTGAMRIPGASASSTRAMGTPKWMAPEQSMEGGEVTPRADVWAIGLIAFAMLTGRSFWKSDHPAEIFTAPIPSASQRAAELGLLDRIPPGFDAWFARAVSRDPAARWAGGAEARGALMAIFDGATPAPSARPTITSAQRTTPPSALGAWLIGCGALALVGLLGVVGVVTVFVVAEDSMGKCSRGDGDACARACFGVADDTDSCFAYGDARARLWSAQGRAEAARAYEKACVDDLEIRGCQRLVALDPAAAIATLERRCSAGGEKECGLLALTLIRADVPADEAKARDLGQRACDHQVAAGCAALAQLALRDADPARAFDLASRACTDQEPRGCALVATLARAGYGTARDPARESDAREKLGRACDKGDTDACTQLGQLGERARFTEACARGSARACHEAGADERACAGGSALGCLGRAAKSDSGDLWEDARKIAQTGCDGRVADGCAALADPRLSGSIDVAEKGCDLGSGEACVIAMGLASGARAERLAARGCALLARRACEQARDPAVHGLAE